LNNAKINESAWTIKIICLFDTQNWRCRYACE